jgi:hypothetical protein
VVNKGFEVQVGAHCFDRTPNNPIRRFFHVSKRYPITSTVTKIANPFGGGIYIVTPYKANLGVVSVQITNAVPAPLFSAQSFSKTTLAEWQNTQRKNPGPWADFVSDKFMMQVPTGLPAHYTCVLNGMSWAGSSIKYGLPSASYVSIKLFTVQGKLVQTICNAYQKSGYYHVGMTNALLSKGFFVLDFKAGHYQIRKRISLF